MQADLFQSYPDAPGWKTDGASKEAALKIKAKAPTLRERVLEAYHAHGRMTADQCAERLGLSILSIRPRVTELFRQGKLEKLDRMITGPHGARQHFYRIAQ